MITREIVWDHRHYARTVAQDPGRFAMVEVTELGLWVPKSVVALKDHFPVCSSEPGETRLKLKSLAASWIFSCAASPCWGLHTPSHEEQVHKGERLLPELQDPIPQLVALRHVDVLPD
jgi:hypothetical protein